MKITDIAFARYPVTAPDVCHGVVVPDPLDNRLVPHRRK